MFHLENCSRGGKIVAARRSKGGSISCLACIIVLWYLLRLRDTRARGVRNVLGNQYLSSLTKNLWYKEREQLDSGGGGTLSQGAGHDGSFF